MSTPQIVANAAPQVTTSGASPLVRAAISATLWRRTARMLSHSNTTHSLSFLRTWSETVLALSSSQIVAMPASYSVSKNFQPVGVP